METHGLYSAAPLIHLHETLRQSVFSSVKILIEDPDDIFNKNDSSSSISYCFSCSSLRSPPTLTDALSTRATEDKSPFKSTEGAAVLTELIRVCVRVRNKLKEMTFKSDINLEISMA